MSESGVFRVELIDYELYKNELLELRKFSWASSDSNVDSEKLISEKDNIIDKTAVHCGIFENQKLIASHRLQPINNTNELPFSDYFDKSKVIDSEWYTFGNCLSPANPMNWKMAGPVPVFIPSSCIPIPVAPWAPAAKKTKLANSPVVLANSKTACAWAGSISVTNPGQTKIDCT